MTFDVVQSVQVIVDEEPHMRFGLVIDHTMLEKHVRKTNVVDREAATRSSVVVTVLEFD